MDEDVGVLEHRFHALGIGNEVWGQVTAVELHAFDYFELGFHRLRLFDGDDAVLADLLHCFRDDLADGLVVVRRDRSDLRDHLARNLLRELVDCAGIALAFGVDRTANRGDSLLDAALQRHRVGAGSNGLYAFAINGLRQNGRGGGAVAGDVGGLGGDFAHHLCAHVLEWILQLDFLGYGDAVLGDERRTELLLDNNVAALGAEGDFHGIREDVYAAQDRLP